MKKVQVAPFLTANSTVGEKYAKATAVLKGLVSSRFNVCIFKDDPEYWFQHYLGLFLEMPTIVVIPRKEMRKVAIQQKLLHPLIIKIIETNGETAVDSKEVAEQINECVLEYDKQFGRSRNAN